MPSLDDDLELEMLAALEADSSEEEDASPASLAPPASGESPPAKRTALPAGSDDQNTSRKRSCHNLAQKGAPRPRLQEAPTLLASTSSPTILSLSSPCILSIMSRLSPEDLCSLAQTNRYFRVAASDPGIWRALFNHRWSSGPSREADPLAADGLLHGTNSRWKEMYLQRDGAEVAAEAARAPEEAREMFLAMVTARRGEPLSPRAAAEIGPLLGTALAERVAAFRRIRGLLQHNNGNNIPSVSINSDIINATQDDSTTAGVAAAGRSRLVSPLPASAATTSAPTTAVSCSEGCSFVELETNYWICEKGGHVHVCGDACTERHIDGVSEMLVCSLTGRCFPRLMSEWEENGGRGGAAHGGDEEGDGARDGEDPGGGDWNAQDGMGGRLGRAFFAGYNATDEKEMLMKFGIRM